MSKKSVYLVSLLVFLVALVAVFIYRPETPALRDEKESHLIPTANDSVRVDIKEVDDWNKVIESKEPAELDAVSWSLPFEPASLPAYRQWTEAERPLLKEIPDTLRWDYFKPKAKRSFTSSEMSALYSCGFFLENTPAVSNVATDDMIDRYESHRIFGYGEDYSTVPLFISSDYLLHVYHVVFDRALQEAEERKLYFSAKRLSSHMLKACRATSSQATDPRLKEAIKGNIAFFSVACSLLDSAFAVPSEVSEIVDAELTLIARTAGTSLSPIFQTEEDYTQYIPRAHYTKSDRLTRYFKAMMWFGRMPFLADSARLTLMALHQTLLLSNAQMKDRWLQLSRPFQFLIGTVDDLTFEDFLILLRQRSSNVTISRLTEFADVTTLKDFMRQAAASGKSKIGDHPSYRFLGQRFTPDAHIFTQLTSPRVGSDANPRNMPTALDVMSVLGSSAADELLKPHSYIPNYLASLQGMKAEYSSLSDKTWTQSVYWRWLDALRAVLKAKDNRFPFFMRTSNWSTKSLLTAVASWSELKHDTILMSKQSYAEMGEGEEGPPPPPQPKSYVEPDMDFFNRYIDLIQHTARCFSDNGLLSEGYLQRFEHLLRKGVGLRDIVRKELTNAQISEQEYKDILEYSGSIAWTVLPEGTGGIIDDRFKQMAIVSDVHTDAFGKMVLEEAVGAPQRIYVATKDASGGSRVCVGYVYTYYEFTCPTTKRMTDEEWKSLVYSGRQEQLAPLEPKWIAPLRVQR